MWVVANFPATRPCAWTVVVCGPGLPGSPENVPLNPLRGESLDGDYIIYGEVAGELVRLFGRPELGILVRGEGAGCEEFRRRSGVAVGWVGAGEVRPSSVLLPLGALVPLFAGRGGVAGAGERVCGGGARRCGPRIRARRSRLISRYARHGGGVRPAGRGGGWGVRGGTGEDPLRIPGGWSRAFPGFGNARLRKLKISSNGRWRRGRIGDRVVAERYAIGLRSPPLRTFPGMSTVSSRVLGNDFPKERHGI